MCCLSSLHWTRACVTPYVRKIGTGPALHAQDQSLQRLGNSHAEPRPRLGSESSSCSTSSLCRSQAGSGSHPLKPPGNASANNCCRTAPTTSSQVTKPQDDVKMRPIACRFCPSPHTKLGHPSTSRAQGQAGCLVTAPWQWLHGHTFTPATAELEAEKPRRRAITKLGADSGQQF